VPATPPFQGRSHENPPAAIDTGDTLGEANQPRPEAAVAVFWIDREDADRCLNEPPTGRPDHLQTEDRTRLAILLGNQHATVGVFREPAQALADIGNPRFSGSEVRLFELAPVCMSDLHVSTSILE
jgi:hypothetical protein